MKTKRFSRSFFAALFASAILVAPRVLAQDAAPLMAISNAGFENGASLPDNWTFSNEDGGEGRWEIGAKSFAGKRSARVVKTNGAGYSMLVSDFVPVTAGKTYEVSGQFHIEGNSRANIYFMVSQYVPGSDAMQFPNEFGAVQSYDTGDGWQKLKLIFPVREGNARVRIHFVMAAAPLDISWDDLQLREAKIGENVYQPRQESPIPEVLPPLEPAIARLKARPRTVAQRRVVDGRARFFLDGKMAEPTFTVLPFVDPNGAHIADFRDAGVKLYLLPLTLGHGVYGDFGPWLGKNQFDFKEVDDKLWRILRVDPEAHIMFYLATDPYLHWADENPDAIVRDQNDQKVVVTMHPKDWGRDPIPTASGYQERWGHSYVSAALRRDTEDAIRHLIAHVQNSLPGKAVAGYHIAGGADGQFFPWAGLKPGDLDPGNFHLADYSPDSRAAFRDWLKRKYKTASTLQAAWNRADVTFENADIPVGARRLAKGFFFDAKTDEDIADYNRFYSEGTAETIQGYARFIKKETNGQNLVSTYWEDAGALVEGHFATGKLISSPDLDFLAGPTDYGVRMPGQSGEAHSMWGSLLLRDRMWISEQDFRSWLSYFSTQVEDDHVGRASNATEHNAMVRRESGMMLAFGQGTWWYDMSSGWFADAGIMKGVKEAREAFTRDLSTRGKPRADVAVFVSERSLDYMKTDAANFRYNALVGQIRELNRAGVPYQIFVQEDVANAKLPDFKCYIFLNAYNIEPNEWRAIQKLKSGGKTLCFVNAAGIVKPEVVGAETPAEAIGKVTGMSASKIGDDVSQNIVPAPKNVAPQFDLKNVLMSPWNGRGPSFRIADDAAVPLGIYAGDKSTAAAYRDFGSWKSVFYGGIVMSDAFINALARNSGAWVAAPNGDAVCANQNFFTIHALWNSEKTLNFLQPSKVTDLTSGEVVATNAKTMKLSMKTGETRWFALEPVSAKAATKRSN